MATGRRPEDRIATAQTWLTAHGPIGATVITDLIWLVEETQQALDIAVHERELAIDSAAFRRERAETAELARDELAGWKASALVQFTKWDAVFKAVEPFVVMRLGEDIPEALAERLPEVFEELFHEREEADAARDAAVAALARVQAVEAEMSDALQAGALFNPDEFHWQQRGRHVIVEWVEELRGALHAGADDPQQEKD